MEQNDIADAFLSDHRQLTRGLSRILRNLKQGDIQQAITLARDVDRHAGSHIEFEENVLYPEVARVRGAGYARKLYQEHRTGQAALRRLLDPTPLKADDIAQLIDQFRVAVDHAASCGTLLSHLTQAPPQRQREMLARLKAYSENGTRWTELPPPAPEKGG